MLVALRMYGVFDLGRLELRMGLRRLGRLYVSNHLEGKSGSILIDVDSQRRCCAHIGCDIPIPLRFPFMRIPGVVIQHRPRMVAKILQSLAATCQEEPRWSSCACDGVHFVVAEPRRSSSVAKEFKAYITNFFKESDPRYGEQIRHDVLEFRRVNQYLKSVDPDIGIATTLDLVAWLKLAHDYWASFGVNGQHGRVDPVRSAYRRAFQDKYFRYRGEREHRSRLALVVADDVFRRLENGELDIEAVEQLDECYALDVFLLCHVEDGWLSGRWRIWYVDREIVSQALIDPDIPDQMHSVKTN